MAEITIRDVPIPPVTCPWGSVELHCLGPFENSQQDQLFLMVLFDPVSMWTVASPAKSCLTSEAPHFLVENMCNFGVTHCFLFGVPEDQFIQTQKM